MTEPDADAIFDELRADLPEDATISLELINALEGFADGDEGGFYTALGSIVGGMAAIETRLLDLEKHVHLGE